MMLILEVLTPPFERARSTFLLSARFACLVALALPSAAGAADVAGDSLLCDHALIDTITINAPPANLIVSMNFIACSSCQEPRQIPAGIAGPPRHDRWPRTWAAASYRPWPNERNPTTVHIKAVAR
jgi:hypothetical protein